MEERMMSLGMLGSEITALKETLCAQQQVLQKLYNELDMEREASSTAASEALSMILRLQVEKATMKMEANQYKRLAEEKMCHAEEALSIFEDLIYQKEMEIASLEYQVQAYKYKLLSLGCSDIGICETKFPENLLQRNENFVGDVGFQTNLRRNSMPTIPLKFTYQKRGSAEKERSASPELISKIDDENMNCELFSRVSDMEKKSENSTAGDINSYWEQISKLDEQVREIADGKGTTCTNMSSGSRAFSLVSQASTGLMLDSTKSDPKNSLENEATANPSCSSGVHDVFEVPQTLESEKGRGKRDSLPLEAVKSYVKDETDWLKKIFPSKHQKSIMPGPSDKVAVDCHLALVHPKLGVAESHSKFQQLHRTLEIIEVEREPARPENAIRGDEELNLLKEIQEQLNLIRSEITEIRRGKSRKSSPSYELPLHYLTEAMLHFWL
ncbi:Myosin-binding protein [Actinidia chinensis var. chinensis]|uniref:Myosin-binding protein n=1 Tax=Actinidia chinensis var. chinensis TaxID=1590841 RepID=A0A2R6R4W1_ACTCC|nr:Myosin-binding protein [Actinidia chinensis var. chinensis]